MEERKESLGALELRARHIVVVVGFMLVYLVAVIGCNGCASECKKKQQEKEKSVAIVIM